jgi:hypothetical protein
VLNAEDRALVLATSEEIIAGSGESVTRMRLVVDEPPASMDDDFGEPADSSEEEYDELTVVVKVFGSPGEKLVAGYFGGQVELDALVHVPAAADVRTGDWLVRADGTWLELGIASPAPLGGFVAMAAKKVKARQAESEEEGE